VGGAAQEASLLFAARGLQGAFAALLAPAALSLIAVTFVDPHERARAFGVYGAVAGAGGALGLVLGGLLTQYGSWRWTLFVNVPIALVAVLAALQTVRESRSPGERHYDVPGAVLVTGALRARP
jgi:MFS family permease